MAACIEKIDIGKVNDAFEYFVGMIVESDAVPYSTNAFVFYKHLLVAAGAAEELDEHSLVDLQTMRDSGCRIPESVMVRSAQKAVLTAKMVIEETETYPKDPDDIEQAINVLAAYREIHKLTP